MTASNDRSRFALKSWKKALPGPNFPEAVRLRIGWVRSPQGFRSPGLPFQRSKAMGFCNPAFVTRYRDKKIVLPCELLLFPIPELSSWVFLRGIAVLFYLFWFAL